jgi:hypothetical protein
MKERVIGDVISGVQGILSESGRVTIRPMNGPVPASGVGLYLLWMELEKLKNDSAYTPPECMRENWVKLCYILNGRLNNPPRESWEVRIERLVQGRDQA